MTIAKISQAEANAINVLRDMAPEDTRRTVKKEIFARAKAQFGIPANHKLVVETSAAADGFCVLRNKATRETYELNDAGRWVNAPVQNGTTGHNGTAWFKLPVNDLIDAVVEGLDTRDSSGNGITAQRNKPEGVVYTDRNGRHERTLVIDVNGAAWVQMDDDSYDSSDIDDGGNDGDDDHTSRVY